MSGLNYSTGIDRQHSRGNTSNALRRAVHLGIKDNDAATQVIHMTRALASTKEKGEFCALTQTRQRLTVEKHV